MKADNGTGAAQKKRPAPSQRARHGGKVKLLTLEDLDRRTQAARHAQQHRDALVSDLGGADRLTAGQNALVQRTAILHAVLSDQEVRYLRDGQLDMTAYLAVCGEFRRMAMTLGIAEREAKVVNGPPAKTLDSYLS